MSTETSYLTFVTLSDSVFASIVSSLQMWLPFLMQPKAKLFSEIFELNKETNWFE